MATWHPSVKRSVTYRWKARIEDLPDGQTAGAPMVDRHLMSDGDGMCPIGDLNLWEREVVAKELSRPTSVGWYRNPPRQSVDSLGVAYRDEVGNWRSMHPDFVFFKRDRRGRTPVNRGPARPSPRGLVSEAPRARKVRKTFGDKFHRIEAVSKLATSMRILDLKVPAVRDAILAGKKPPLELYESHVAIEYDL